MQTRFLQLAQRTSSVKCAKALEAKMILIFTVNRWYLRFITVQLSQPQRRQVPILKVHHPNLLSPRIRFHLVESLGPELGQPLIGVLGLVLVGDLALKVDDVIPCLVVESILLIRSVADVVGHSLDIVANLLVDNASDVVDLGVLEAELIAIVRVDLEQASAHDNSDVRCHRVLTMPILRPFTATTFWMVAFRLAWLRQLPQDW